MPDATGDLFPCVRLTVTDPSGTTTYTWNARDQLVSLSGPSVTASFTYDALGRRKSKTVNGTTTNFLYDGLNVVQELNGTIPTANLLTSLGIDETLLRTDAAGARSFLADGLGSTLALTDAGGLVQSEYSYEPFGKTTNTGAASTNAFKYTGREDDGTGLYYYRARYYHPTLQRFISQDPIGFAGGDLNLYAYVSHRVPNLVDPYGLLGYPAAYGVGAALGAAGGAYGASNPGTGAVVGGVIGAAFSPLIVAVPPGPGGALAGAYFGAVCGAGSAAAGGGNPITGAIAGGIGGAIGGLIGGGIGAAVGTAASGAVGSLF